MAIIKLMHMSECSGHNPAQHLKNAIEYIKNPEKTQSGRLIGSVNCTTNAALQEMLDVKKQFGKENLRQGYHFVISFVPGEVNADTAYEITQKLVGRYLEDYQTIFAVHDDKEHMHSHIIFNSVSWVNGLKYHYPNGEWERTIQPLLNELCKEYNLSTINLDALHETKNRQGVHYAEWKADKENKLPWRKQVLDVVTKTAGASENMEDFLKKMQEQGYEVRNKKHISISPSDGGKHRPVRVHADEVWKLILKSGDNYYYHSGKVVSIPKVRSTFVPRKLCKLQKNYIRKLYRTGKMMKRRRSSSGACMTKNEEWFRQLKKEYNLINQYQSDVSGFQLKERVKTEALLLEEEQRLCYKDRVKWKGAFLMLQMSRDVKDEAVRKSILKDMEERYGAIEPLMELEKEYAFKVQDIRERKKENKFMLGTIEKIEKSKKEDKNQERIKKSDKGRNSRKI